MEQRLVDADVLYEQIAKKEKLAQQRVLDTPSRMPNGDLNPSAIRYFAQLDERTQMKFMIADAPTVDAEPVRHGKWIIRDNPKTEWYRVTCSECGEDVTSTAPCIGFFPNAKVIWDYCPNCGARMDKE